SVERHFEAEGRLDQSAVIVLDRRYHHAVFRPNDARPWKLCDVRSDTFQWFAFVLVPDVDVRLVSLLEILHQRLGANRTNHRERCQAASKWRGNPAREPDVWQPNSMVGMKMSQEGRIERADRDAHLPESGCSASASIEQQALTIDDNQRARSHPADSRV